MKTCNSYIFFSNSSNLCFVNHSKSIQNPLIFLILHVLHPSAGVHLQLISGPCGMTIHPRVWQTAIPTSLMQVDFHGPSSFHFLAFPGLCWVLAYQGCSRHMGCVSWASLGSRSQKCTNSSWALESHRGSACSGLSHKRKKTEILWNSVLSQNIRNATLCS